MTSDRQPRRQGFWLTVGEVVAALALLVAGLNFWESHQQRLDTARRAATETSAQTAFVAQGQVSKDGRQILLSPLRPAQAISVERYVFPRAVLDGPKDVSAAQPRIEADWLAPGLRRILKAGRAKGPGHGHLPVVIETTYVQDGDPHHDASIYEIGYDWRPRLFQGDRIRLEGLALSRRGVSGDEQKLVDAAWASEVPKLAK